MDETTHQPQDLISRRSMMFKGAALGVGATAVGRLLVDPPDVFAKKGHTKAKGGRLTKGDAAILRFLCAAEIIESDLWQQYNELAGIQDGEVPGGSGNDAYTEAVEVLDEDMNQYIHDNTDDEFSHVAFINAYLQAHGEKPVNLDRFRTLPSSQADGAQKNVGRLTNLMQLSVDTSFWTRYRTDTFNPDLGDTVPQAVPTLAVGQHPAIPRDNNDVNDANHLQAIANTAGFHFAFIEAGGTSLYASLAQRVTSKEVLRILLSIGGSEIMHFQTWHDKAGNAPPLTDGGLVFPDLNADGEITQTNLILPEPTRFLKRKFPQVSIIRPTETKGAAMGAAQALNQDGLFIGQPPAFFTVLTKLAKAADAARPRH
ncbi:MAG: ferritin-like domain-containing protein [Solirubrobacterales bacterium]